MSTTPSLPQLGDRIPPVAVLTEENEPVSLAQVWSLRPAALFFLRHLG